MFQYLRSPATAHTRRRSLSCYDCEGESLLRDFSIEETEEAGRKNLPYTEFLRSWALGLQVVFGIGESKL